MLRRQKKYPITNFVFPAVNLKEWDGAFAVDLVAWRMS